MALQRAYLKQLMLSLGDREATYDAGPALWTSPAACSMIDMPDSAAYETWDDTHQGDTDVITGKEFQSVHEIVRQSMRLTYEEPRTKPNTLAGLVGLTLGTVVSTQDGTLTAYRHKITPASSVSLPSIGAQTLRDSGVQRKYTGVKSDSFMLAENGPYFRSQSALIGSGTRATAVDAFTAAVSETWLRWGDCQIFVKDTAGTPISIPSTPSQAAANLGGSEVNFSTRVLAWSLNWMNNLQPEMGYRASTALVRQNFHSSRRRATLTIKFECDTASEATELNYYLNQSKLAIELNINSGTVIAATGAFKFGAIFLVPRIQLTALPRSQTQELENLEMQGEILDDGTNPQLAAFVFNTRSAYLA